MELQIYQVNGSETGRTVALDAGVFGIEPNDHVLWLDVRRTQASRRQGTHKTKERGEVAGSTRKLYRQKGTGLARSGNIASPLRRSGGRIFGPRPHAYSLKLNKKTRRLARRSALSYKAQAEAIRVVESLAFVEPDTSRLIEIIDALGLEGKKVLVLTEQNATALYRSSSNLSKVHVQEARNASAEQLLGAGVLLFEEGALERLTTTLREEASSAEPTSSDAPSAEAAADEAEAPAAVDEVVEAGASEEVAETASAEVKQEAEAAVAEEALAEQVVEDAAEAPAETMDDTEPEEDAPEEDEN